MIFEDLIFFQVVESTQITQDDRSSVEVTLNKKLKKFTNAVNSCDFASKCEYLVAAGRYNNNIIILVAILLEMITILDEFIDFIFLCAAKATRLSGFGIITKTGRLKSTKVPRCGFTTIRCNRLSSPRAHYTWRRVRWTGRPLFGI